MMKQEVSVVTDPGDLQWLFAMWAPGACWSADDPCTAAVIWGPRTNPARVLLHMTTGRTEIWEGAPDGPLSQVATVGATRSDDCLDGYDWAGSCNG